MYMQHTGNGVGSADDKRFSGVTCSLIPPLVEGTRLLRREQNRDVVPRTA